MFSCYLPGYIQSPSGSLALISILPYKKEKAGLVFIRPDRIGGNMK